MQPGVIIVLHFKWLQVFQEEVGLLSSPFYWKTWLWFSSLSSLTKQLKLLYSDNSILSCVTCHLIKSMKNSPTFFTVVKILRVHLFNFKSFILDETKITQFSPNATVCQGSRVHFFGSKNKNSSKHTVRNLHFLSKNSILISRENCRFFGGWKTREIVVVLDFFAVDNFDFTGKNATKFQVKNSWKCWRFVKIEFLYKNVTFRIVCVSHETNVALNKNSKNVSLFFAFFYWSSHSKYNSYLDKNWRIRGEIIFVCFGLTYFLKETHKAKKYTFQVINP